MSFLHDATESWFHKQVEAADATVIHRYAAAGAMPPLTTRDAREVYRVIEGEVTFFVEDEVVTASQGDVVVAAAGAARTFRVESDAAHWVVVARVHSTELYIDFGRAVTTRWAMDWPDEAERIALEGVARANGIELLAPPGVLPASRSVTA
jgi:mannose-6-phosphate isomerase-like protein (cupin superfamily)